MSDNEKCRLLPAWEVVHYDCTDYKDGVVTQIARRGDGLIVVAHMFEGERVDV